MSTKQEIISSLGEKQLLLPGLVQSGLAANDRIKYFFTLLQMAMEQCAQPAPNPPDLKRESQLLKRKLANGADFFLTQPVYDPSVAKGFFEAYNGENGQVEKPILVGILPLFGARHASFLHNEVPGIEIPDAIRARIDAAGSDGPQEGVRIAIELIEAVRPWAQGVYIIPAFGRYDLAAEIIEAIK